MIPSKTINTIGLVHKLKNHKPISALLTIYKVLLRPRLDYGDIMYDEAYNTSFHQ